MLKIINNTIPLRLKGLGYDETQAKDVTADVDKHDTIEGAPHLKEEHLAVFDCAFKPATGVRSIAWRSHVRMMAAAQPFLSGAISKTVNMPHDTTPDDISEAYRWGWKLGLKALAIYRDGSKQSQPLSTQKEGDKSEETVTEVVRGPHRERLPETRQSLTHKFSVGGHEGYINVGLYPSGNPGELFITMAKEGSTVGGLMDCFGTAISMSLQYGVPLEVLVNKFAHARFEPMGHTSSKDIRIAKSVVDYIFRWLGIHFLPGYREANNGLPPETAARKSDDSKDEAELAAEKLSIGAKAEPSLGPGGNGGVVDLELLERAGVAVAPKPDGSIGGRADQFARFQSDAPSCDNCGAITVRNGNCYLCHNCGNSMGCS
jgi:ribonucleoside-diphosphate reductase alpha chain